MSASVLERPASASSQWRIAGSALFCVSALLLVSMGGAIIAAPLTVPLLFVVVQKRPTTAFRALGAVLAAATVAELVWALTYLAAGESKPWIWLLPLLAAIAIVVVLLRMTTPHAR